MIWVILPDCVKNDSESELIGTVFPIPISEHYSRRFFHIGRDILVPPAGRSRDRKRSRNLDEQAPVSYVIGAFDCVKSAVRMESDDS